jgi:hypothetical protein
MNCDKCKKAILSPSPYYLNVNFKIPLRVCHDCYLIVTQGMGGHGWYKILFDKDGETNPQHEALIMLKNVLHILESGDFSL